MSLIALELCDAGIMAAAGNPARLIPVDGPSLESPGYILPIKKKLSVGKSAESKAHLYPRQIQHRFWDQLSTLPLKQPERWTGNFAEMAHTHLAAIWRQIKPSGRSLVITLPGYFTREQMGILLGITQDLDIEVNGLINQAVAAIPYPFAATHLLYVDTHLHRTEVSLLEQGDHLRHMQTLMLDKGLIGVQRTYIEAMAEAFVATTRYDPLHTAASEQALYDCLPEMLSKLADNATATVETRSDHTVHSISMTRDALIDKADTHYEQVCGLIRSLIENSANTPPAATVLMSHRLMLLPGLETYLRNHLKVDTLSLKPGAAALNALEFWGQLEQPADDSGAFFFKQRPWTQAEQSVHNRPNRRTETILKATHLLHRDVAYPLTASPLAIVYQGPGERQALAVVPADQARSGIIGTLYLEQGDAILSASGPLEVHVDGRRVTGRTTLMIGQRLEIANIEDTFRLITCL